MVNAAGRRPHGGADLPGVHAPNLEIPPGEGLGERLSAYALTPQGRTVYLFGPHSGEGPHGLHLVGDRVMLYGVDERGQPVSWHGRTLQRLDCYVFVAGRLM